MPDWSRYRPLLLDVLGARPLVEELSPGEVGLRVLFQPNFHADVCLTWAAALVEVAVLVRGREEVMRRVGAKGMGPEHPVVVQRELADPDPAFVARILATLAGVADEPAHPMSRDGMTITFQWATRDTAGVAEAWSPGSGSPLGRLSNEVQSEASRLFPMLADVWYPLSRY